MLADRSEFLLQNAAFAVMCTFTILFAT